MPLLKQPLIVFAIPSFNEVENISLVTRVIDIGLSRYFKKAKAVIVNTDNDSPDGTKQAFLSTLTKHKKIYLTSKGKPLGMRGKGYHMRMALELAKEMKADAIGFIDGDVSSARPEWVRDLAAPLLKGYDTVLPAYLRNEYDGSITNHFVYPLLYGLLLADIRQPIAGEIGLSQRAINLMLSERWYPTAYPQILSTSKDNDFWLPNSTGSQLKFQNVNNFYLLPEFIGGKTGYLPEAKQTLASVFNIGQEPVAVVLLYSANRQADAFNIIKQLRQ